MAYWILRGRETAYGFVACRTTERGYVTTYHCDPRDLKIERLPQRVRELELHHEATRKRSDYDAYIELVVEEVVISGDGDVIYVDHAESLTIQHVLSDDFEEDINLKSHELMWFEKSIIIRLAKVRSNF
nr:hypothetical protein [Tanacetum cinerariifolium]